MIKFMALGAVAAALFGGQGALGAVRQVESESVRVSGSKVSGVHYSLSKTQPGMVTAVSFSLEPANARTVFVRLSPDDPGRLCGSREGSVTCDLGTGYAAEAVTLLEVTAAS